MSGTSEESVASALAAGIWDVEYGRGMNCSPISPKFNKGHNGYEGEDLRLSSVVSLCPCGGFAED
jgi:hypothetical protein